MVLKTSCSPIKLTNASGTSRDVRSSLCRRSSSRAQGVSLAPAARTKECSQGAAGSCCCSRHRPGQVVTHPVMEAKRLPGGVARNRGTAASRSASSSLAAEGALWDMLT